MLDEITSYGKQLESVSANSSTKNYSRLMDFLFRDGYFPHRLAWPSFYIFAWMFNVFFLVAQVRFGKRLDMYVFSSSMSEPNKCHLLAGIDYSTALSFLLLWSMFQVHLSKRIIECLCIHQFSNRYISVVNYIAG